MRIVLALMIVAGCTKRVNICASDTDCRDSAYPFCDVNGEYPASGGEKGVCTVTPTNCPVDRCGCVPGTTLSCAIDQAIVCAPDGKSTVTETCGLGCATDGTRCLTFDPSNGLGDALARSASEPDVVLPQGTTIDTDVGTVVDSSGVPIAINSLVVAQNGGPSIRAFIARSLVADDVTVVGGSALAFVVHGPVTVQGILNASARGVTAGVAEQVLPKACAGAFSQEYVCTAGGSATIDPGTGGGGDATSGGSGGYGSMGGAVVQSFIPLQGGCRAGALENTGGAILRMGGGGGGAIEIVSLRGIILTGRGFINVGGGGGSPTTGGGSGGTVILEAPQIQIEGNTVGITGNGGAGGGSCASGADGTMTTSPALAPSCSNGYPAGNGGTRATSPTNGAVCSGTCLLCDPGPYGGGGGAVGRMRIATRDGAYASTGGPILSIAISAATLTVR